MKTTKKSVFDFIESHDSTIFLYVSLKSVCNEEQLKEILMQNEENILNGKVGKRRKVAHKSSSKIVFDDDSNLYKTDKIAENYTFNTGKLTYYVREMQFECDGKIVHKFMCYAD